MKRLIPTERLDIAIGLGALIPLVLVFGSLLLLRHPRTTKVILFSPFVCGFVASFAFGASKHPSIRHVFPLGTLTFVTFYFLLLSSLPLMQRFSDLRATEELLMVYAISVYPFLIVVPVAVSVVGAIFGWLTARAVHT